MQEGLTLPQLAKCMACQKYHCPFCSPTLFNPTKLSKCKKHLDLHLNRAVCHEGKICKNSPAALSVLHLGPHFANLDNLE